MTTNEIEKVAIDLGNHLAMQLTPSNEAMKAVGWLQGAITSTLTTLTAKHEEEKAAMVREILDAMVDGVRINKTIEAIAAKHRVDLSKTDVTTD